MIILLVEKALQKTFEKEVGQDIQDFSTKEGGREKIEVVRKTGPCQCWVGALGVSKNMGSIGSQRAKFLKRCIVVWNCEREKSNYI